MIFICSPYRGDIEHNTEIASAMCRAALLKGHKPIAPHLMYPMALDDANESERSIGLGAALHLLELCDAVWVYAMRFSEGMIGEIHKAISLGIPVYGVDIDGNSPKARLMQ